VNKISWNGALKLVTCRFQETNLAYGARIAYAGLLLPLRWGKRSIVMTVSVGLSVCLFSIREHIYLQNYNSDLQKIFVRITYGRGSVLLCRRGDTLCTSGFMDDVIFAHNGPYTGVPV